MQNEPTNVDQLTDISQVARYLIVEQRERDKRQRNCDVLAARFQQLEEEERQAEIQKAIAEPEAARNEQERKAEIERVAGKISQTPPSEDTDKQAKAKKSAPHEGKLKE